MSSERALEDVWADRVAMAKSSSRKIPAQLDAETVGVLRDILGDVAVDAMLLTEALALLEAHLDEPEAQDVYHASIHGRYVPEMVINAAAKARERLEAKRT